MTTADIIIVGGGASGLMAARKLSETGLKVIILEGRDRLGGRINTIHYPVFPVPVEAGAEFVHGDLPVTLALLSEADINIRVSGGSSWRFVKGALNKDDDFMGEDDQLSKQLDELKEDITVSAFLDANYSGEEFAATRESIRGFVEGYDAADITKASTFSLRKEWQEMSEGEQHRVNGGYVHMIRFLENECNKNGCHIFLSSTVKKISWEKGYVEITTANDQRYTAKKLVVTVPLGVLCAEYQASAAIQFAPVLTEKNDLFRSLGYGTVIKILLLFKNAFWKNIELPGGNKPTDLGWLFSGEVIPTWWTQEPDDSALLTGWLAGPKATTFATDDEPVILQKALESLCNIFKMSMDDLKALLDYSKVENWLADPFSLGAYSFATPETKASIKRISIPVEDTIFFAGEAFYDGDEIGTVEAALANGLAVAKVVLAQGDN